MRARVRWTLLLCLVAASGCGVLESRDEIDLAGLFPHARTATDELCSVDVPCNQAVTSSGLTAYRFDEQEEAVAAARQ